MGRGVPQPDCKASDAARIPSAYRVVKLGAGIVKPGAMLLSVGTVLISALEP